MLFYQSCRPELSHSEKSFGNAVTEQQQEHFIASKSSSPLKEVSGTEVLFSSASSNLLGPTCRSDTPVLPPSSLLIPAAVAAEAHQGFQDIRASGYPAHWSLRVLNTIMPCSHGMDGGGHAAA